MNRGFLTLVMVASVAFADDPTQRPGQIPRDPPAMPLAVGGGFVAKIPMLRTWVQGWKLTGSKTEAYEMRCDDVFSSCEVAILRTKAFASEPYGMGSITHVEGAETWRGRRVRLRAELRSGRIDGWGGLWMRVDDASGKALAFDNMQNRPLRGTAGFEWYSVVLDVPPDAARITFGVMLHGPGAVFIRELEFGEVDATSQVTDLMGPLKPHD